jgi:hypothetical protein
VFGVVVGQEGRDEVTPRVRRRQIQVFHALVAHQLQVVVLGPRDVLKTVWELGPVWVDHRQRLVFHVHQHLPRAAA